VRYGRRRLLSAGGLLFVGLAGCIDGGSSGDDTDGPGETGTDAGTPTDINDSELDLREANVTAVELERADGGYRVSVTLYHDDDGEEGYANWWQVETVEGDRLGRRDLAHSHGTQEFTRSETIEIPDGVDCVIVRGHDQTHGYGGRAVLAALDSGGTRPLSQGPEPTEFDGSDCPE
jgi:hypothetical protein